MGDVDQRADHKFSITKTNRLRLVRCDPPADAGLGEAAHALCGPYQAGQRSHCSGCGRGLGCRLLWRLHCREDARHQYGRVSECACGCAGAGVKEHVCGNSVIGHTFAGAYWRGAEQMVRHTHLQGAHTALPLGFPLDCSATNMTGYKEIFAKHMQSKYKAAALGISGRWCCRGAV